jgi:hypothetical protein
MKHIEISSLKKKQPVTEPSEEQAPDEQVGPPELG